MIVRLLARTALNWDQVYLTDYAPHDEEIGAVKEADELAELAGRLCYRSWSRPNPATATNDGYLRNIIEQQHFSVLEHASATFYVGGVSRSLSHEQIGRAHV